MKIALHGFVLIFSIVISAFVVGVALIGPSFLLPIPRRWWHLFVDRLKYLWFAQCVYLLERWCGTKFVMSGDVSSISEALVISNHRTRLDWMYLWAYFFRVKALSTLRIMLKAELRSLPVVGWGMQSLLFAFVERDWSKDESYLLQLFKYLRDLRLPSSHLMFPEGTDLSEHRLAASHKFAEKAGLPQYQYVLHPRVKGFNCCVQELRPNIECVVDITMGYVDYVPGERPSEASLLGARYPKEVHFHITKHPLESIPKDEAGVEAWLKSRFAEKEVLLKKFYEGCHSVRRKNREESNREACSSAPLPLHRNQAEPLRTSVPLLSLSLFFSSFFSQPSILVLTCLCLLFGLALARCVWFRWYCGVSVCAWVLITAFGGLDRFELRHFAHGKSA